METEGKRTGAGGVGERGGRGRAWRIEETEAGRRRATDEVVED